MISVILADDHPALRVGLRVLLDREPDITVVGEADDGDAALAVLETLRPDVTVLDCQLPGRDGVAVAAAARAQGVPVRVVALSAYDDDRYLAGMAAVGAVGYLLKNEAPGRIVAAARAAIALAALLLEHAHLFAALVPKNLEIHARTRDRRNSGPAPLRDSLHGKRERALRWSAAA